MPQLDKLSFVPQLLYFFIVFFVLYLFLAKIVLPALGRSLKLRERVAEFTGKRVEEVVSSSNVISEYKGAIKEFSSKIGQKVSKTEENFRLSQDLNDLVTQRGKVVSKIKKISLKEMKLAYIRVLSV